MSITRRIRVILSLLTFTIVGGLLGGSMATALLWAAWTGMEPGSGWALVLAALAGGLAVGGLLGGLALDTSVMMARQRELTQRLATRPKRYARKGGRHG